MFENIEVKFSHRLEHTKKIVIAGSAGSGVQFVASRFAHAAVASGLRVTQKNDNPVTVGTGFSTSELIFSKREILYTGIETPDYVVLTSEDGHARVKRKIAGLRAGKILAEPSLRVDAPVEVIYWPPHRLPKVKGSVNAAALAHLLRLDPFIPAEALLDSLAPGPNGNDLTEIVRKIARNSS